MRRSQRVRDSILRRPPIEVITIGDTSSDEDVSLHSFANDNEPSPISPCSPGQTPNEQQEIIPEPQNQGPRPKSVEPPSQTPATSQQSNSSQPRQSQQQSQGTPIIQQTQPIAQKQVPTDGQRSQPLPQAHTHHQTPRLPLIQQKPIRERMKQRKLVLEKIVGATQLDDQVYLVVKWKSLTQLERISLQELKILFPEQVLDYMCQRIKWAGQKRGRPKKVPSEH